HPRVVDEQVNGLGRPVAGEGAHRLQVGEVEEADLVRSWSRQGAGSVAAPAFVPDRENHARAAGGESLRRLQADAAARTGHDDGPAGEVRDVHYGETAHQAASCG